VKAGVIVYIFPPDTDGSGDIFSDFLFWEKEFERIEIQVSFLFQFFVAGGVV
jgi:hypothetical protein